MKSMYVITKHRQRAWGYSSDRVHEVCEDRKTANARAKELNEKATNLIYEVVKASFYRKE